MPEESTTPDPIAELKAQLEEQERELIALRESESSYRAVVDHQASLICRYRADDYRIVFANPAFCQFFDRPLKDVLSASFLDILPEEERPGWSAHLADLGDKHEATSHQHHMHLPDGTSFWHQWREIPLMDLRPDQPPIAIIQASATDITQQKNQEAALRRSATMFWSISELITQASESLKSKVDRILDICCKHLHLDIGIVSQIEEDTYTILFARSPDDAIEAEQTFPLSDTYCEKTFGHPGTTGFHHAAIEPTWKNHPAYKNFQLESYIGASIFIDDKAYGTLNFSSAEPRATPFSETECTLVSLAAQWIGFELGRHQSQEALVEKSEELADSNEELERFAYVVSHDLQEPLRTVTSFTDLLGEIYADSFDEEAAKMMGFIQDATQHMQRMLQDLLEYSRVTSLPMEREMTSMDDVLAGVVRSLDSAIQKTNATIEYDSLPTLNIHPTLTHQLFQNLISNAIKFRGDVPPVIQVRAKQIGERAWSFLVQDNGIGMEPRHLDRIFDVFQRLHKRGEYEGNGIGLAVCKRIVDKHGGQIYVTSEPGTGTTFTFTYIDA